MTPRQRLQAQRLRRRREHRRWVLQVEIALAELERATRAWRKELALLTFATRNAATLRALGLR